MTAPLMDFSSKVALVTGGTSGVGLMAAEAFARGGADVFVTGRDSSRGQAAQARLRIISDRVTFFQGDAGDAGSLDEIVHKVRESSGRIDILVSAGADGSVGPRPFEQMSPEDVRSEFETLLYPRLFPVVAALPAMTAGGSIVLLSTDAARHATPGESVVGAYGAAVIAFTKTLAKELSRRMIRVNCIAMTLTADTLSWDNVFAEPGFQRDLFTKAAAKFPFGRPPTASEVSNAVAFLASDAASQISGQTLSVNGALSFGGW